MAVTLPRETTEAASRRSPRSTATSTTHRGANETLRPYLSERWRRHHETLRRPRPRRRLLPARQPERRPRRRLAADRARRPAPTSPFLREQLLDAWDIEYGILNPLLGAGGQLQPRATAPRWRRPVNDWQIAEWLEPEPRLRASLVVPYEDGDLAAAEIERLGDDPRFVQVLLAARTQRAARAAQVLADVRGGRARTACRSASTSAARAARRSPAPAGPPSTSRTTPACRQAFQAQVISLVFEGVFERFPTLKIVLIEGGFAWLPSLMWRLDRGLEAAARRGAAPEAAAVGVHPRALLAHHPADGGAAASRSTSSSCSTHLGMNDRLMFATDYPHWDFDAPDQALPGQRLPPELERDHGRERARRSTASSEHERSSDER